MKEEIAEAFEKAKPMEHVELADTLYRGHPLIDTQHSYYSATKSYALGHADPVLKTVKARDWSQLDVAIVPNMMQTPGDRIRDIWAELADVIVSTNKAGINNYVMISEWADSLFEVVDEQFYIPSSYYARGRDLVEKGSKEYNRIIKRMEEALEDYQLYGDADLDYAEFAHPDPQEIGKLQNRLMAADKTAFTRSTLPYMSYDEVVGFIERFLDTGRTLYDAEQSLVDLIRAYKIQYGEGEKQMWDFINKTDELRMRIKEGSDFQGAHITGSPYEVEKLWREVETFNNKVLSNIVYRGAETGDQIYSFFSENMETALRFVERHELPTLLAAKLDWSDMKMIEVSSTPFHMPSSELEGWFDADILVHRYDLEEWAYLLLSDEAKEATTRLNLTMQEIEGYIFRRLVEGAKYADLFELGSHWSGTEAGTLFVNAIDEYVYKLYDLFAEGDILELFVGEEEELIEALTRIVEDIPHSAEDLLDELRDVLKDHSFIGFSDLLGEDLMPGAQSYDFAEFSPRYKRFKTEELRRLIPEIQKAFNEDVATRLINTFADIEFVPPYLEGTKEYFVTLSNMVDDLEANMFDITDIWNSADAGYTGRAMVISNYLRDQGFDYIRKNPQEIGQDLLRIIREGLAPHIVDLTDEAVNELLYATVDRWTQTFGAFTTGRHKSLGNIAFLYPNILQASQSSGYARTIDNFL